MSMIMAKLVISHETIKPSSTTPRHLKNHNLSLLDQQVPNLHIPLVFFYQNYKNSDFKTLKTALSQCLTQYYPFGGKFFPPKPYIDTNDQGVEFLEASIDTRLHDFIIKKEQDETLDQLVPNALGCDVNKTSPNLVEVQLNHFTCGGAAVAVSISHKIADAFTMVNFVNHWATITRGTGSPVNPTFFSSPASNTRVLDFNLKGTSQLDYAIKRFVFPNSKLNELKNKINTMGANPVDPTRVESVTSLLFRCAVGAAKTKSGCSQPSNLSQAVNIRKRMSPNLPESVAGNFSIAAVAKMADSDNNNIELPEVITNLRKEINKYEGVRDVEEISKIFANSLLTLGGNNQTRTYYFSSLCTFPIYQVDFGWGKPDRVILRASNADGDFLFLMDTPSGDGIEATVKMDIDEMSIFEKNKELLAYVQDI